MHRTALRLLFLTLTLVLLSSLALADTASYAGVSYDLESERIDLGSTVVKDFDAFYDFLRKFPGLKQVDMYATDMHKPRLEEMSSLFPDIEFGWTIHFGEHTVRTDWTAFSTLHGEEGPYHGTDELCVLKYCKKLKALDFGHNSATDISFLPGLTELRVLIMADNKITDISPLANLKKLEYLELFTNRVTDITPLSGLTHLMDLNLCLNNIEDVSPLFTMPGLKRLWSAGMMWRPSRKSLDEATMARLRELCPEIEINNTAGNPTAGTWRKHPHYSVIYHMFRAHIYEPFDDSYPNEDLGEIPAPIRILTRYY